MLRKIEKLTIIVILMGMFLNTGLMASAENSEPLQELDNKQIEIINNPETKEDQTDIIDDEIDENDGFIEDELVNSDQALDPNETDADRELNKPPEMVEDEEEERLAEHVLNVGVQPLIPLPLMINQRRMQTFSLTDTIAVDKTAERCIGDCRTFEVTLDITGEPQEAPVDVVLVIDRSGSMGFTATTNPTRTRLYYAKQAAINFAGRVLGPNGIPGSRVSVVSFSGPTSTWGNGNQNQASTDLNLSTNLTTVTNTINGISASGGTNTEAGFKQGQAVIQGNASNQNPNSNKVVIMLTDGLPTASNGNLYADTTDINHVHIQSAIDAGENIFENNIADVFTIGLTTGMNANEKALADDILTQAQNKGYYPAPQSTDLDAIFDAISQNLGYAATNAEVVDKIGSNFEFVAGSLSTTVGSASENSGTITWNPGTIVNAAQLKYKVVAKDSFVGGMADTNEFATLTYKDVFGTAGKTKTFPVPQVTVPTLIEIELTNATIVMGQTINLGAGIDPSEENYMSPVTGGDNDGSTFTYKWRKEGETTVISTAKNPSVKPLVDTNYEVTVTDSNGCIVIGFITIFVTEPTVNITANKVWSGGPTVKPTIEFQLYQNGVAYGTAVELVNGVTSKAWNNLPKLDEEANDYLYTVKEIGAPENYSKDESGLTVTNTYVSPKIDITGTKTWINGPEDKPDIQIELYRNGVKVAGPVTLISGVTTYTWAGMDKTDNAGVDYTYTIKEIGSLGSYTKEEIGLTVTNTYTSPADGEFTATKQWVGGPKPLDVVRFQLLQNGEAIGDPVGLEGLTYTWTNLVVTDEDGVAYEYSFEESTVPANYAVTYSEDGLTAINTYTSPADGMFTATKQWVGGPKPLDVVRFQLLQNGEAIGDPVGLEGLTYTWTNLVVTDEDGVAYEYSFEESTVPANYAVTYSEDGLTAINTYTSPADGMFTATKQWVGGPKPLDVVRFQLLQNGEAIGDPVGLEGLTYTWTNLVVTDEDGVAYEYSFEESTVPANYAVTYSEDGLTAINTYTSPADGMFTATKQWVGGPKPLDVVRFQLLQNGEAIGDPVGLEGLTYTWTNLVVTDEDGVAYEYSFEESTVPANYAVTYSEDGLTAINTYTSPADGMFTATKQWVGGPKPLDVVRFQLLQNGEAIGDPVGLEGLTYTWTNLVVTDEDGVAYEYSFEESTVPANYAVTYSEDGLTAINTYTSPVDGMFTATKQWVGGPKPLDVVRFQLLQNGEAIGDPVGLEGLTYTWTNLIVTDEDGVAYEYSFEESTVPANYAVTYSEDGLTAINTYVSPKIDIFVEKVWVGRVGEEVTINLFADGVAQEYSLYLNAEGEWTGTFEDLDMNDIDGKEIVYTIEESVSGRYISAITGSMEDGFIVTNTYNPYVPPTVSIPVEKVWVGAELESVTIALYADGQLTSERLILNAANNWSGRFNGQAQYSGGSEIVYTVNEVDLDDNYTSEVTGSMETGFVVTNTEVYTSPLIDVTGNKVWILGPEVKPTIQIQLYRDGIAYRDPVDLVDGVTSYTWVDLDETDADGKVYVYTIDEVETPENYDKLISEDGLTITNIFFEVAGEFIPDEGGGKPAVKPPVTGIANNEMIYLSAMILSLGALMLLKRKKKI